MPATYRPPMFQIRQIRILQDVLAEIARLAEQYDPQALDTIRRRAAETADPEWAPAEALRQQRERNAHLRERIPDQP